MVAARRIRIGRRAKRSREFRNVVVSYYRRRILDVSSSIPEDPCWRVLHGIPVLRRRCSTEHGRENGTTDRVGAVKRRGGKRLACTVYDDEVARKTEVVRRV